MFWFSKNRETKETRYGISCLFITDMHGRIKEEEMDFLRSLHPGRYDACFLLGDNEYRDVEKILTAIPVEKCYTLLGNHDTWTCLDDFGIPNIHGKTVEVKGVRFAGLQGSKRYKRNPDRVMYTPEESRKIAEEMRNLYFDILLTHDKAMTEPLTEQNLWNAHSGMPGICELIREKEPKYHVHGHLHRQMREQIGSTASIGVYRVSLMEL